MQRTYGPATEGDLPAIARVLSHAFAGTVEGSAQWVQSAGIEHVRVMRDGEAGPPVACLLRIPMGEFFGGRSVPLVGIAGVGVAPEARGRGWAASIMARAVQEISREGIALSGLYPATQPLYRRVGYEQAGHRFEIRLPLSALAGGDRGLTVRPLVPGDAEEVAACYSRFASRFNGPLDRGPYVWGRVSKSRDTEYHGFAVVGESGAIDGYLYINQARKPDRGRQELSLSDLAFTSPAAGRRLLGFLRDFASIADNVVFFGGPMHPLLMLLDEQRYRMDLRDQWMLRITDLKAACRARGFFPAIRGELHIDLRDELIPAQQGRWVLTIEGGVCNAERGGRGDLALPAGALASIYSGYAAPHQLALAGLCSGPDEAMDMAAAMFSGATPWMSDMY